MNGKRLFQIVVMALLIVGAAYLLSIVVRPSQTADGDSEGEALAADPQTAEPASKAVSALDSHLPITATKEGLTFEVLDYRWEENEARFDVKFPLVDERDWQIRNVVYLEIDGEEYPLRRTEPVEILRPAVDGEQVVQRVENGVVTEAVVADTGEAYRIDTLAFGDVPADLDQRDFTLMIKEINTLPNEGGYCDPYLIQSIQGQMAGAFPGIEVVCISEPGFDGLSIAPDSAFAKDTDALSLLDTVVLRALNARIIGLWAFSFGG